MVPKNPKNIKRKESRTKNRNESKVERGNIRKESKEKKERKITKIKNPKTDSNNGEKNVHKNTQKRFLNNF